MSTSDGNLSVRPQPLLDVASIQQLANSFFKAVPGEAVASPQVVEKAPQAPILQKREAAASVPVVPNETLTPVPPQAPEADPFGVSLLQADLRLVPVRLDAFQPFEAVDSRGVPGFPALAEPRIETAAPLFAAAGFLQINPYDFAPLVVPELRTQAKPFDGSVVRKDFPILEKPVNGKCLVWLDNAATTQKPRAVIDRLTYFYENENSNIHRAAHTLAARATDAYEEAREKVRGFLNASSTREIVFVRGATEAINLVAKAWGGKNVEKGDDIIVTLLEHHANIVPWQQLAAEKGARLRVAPVDDQGQILLEEYEKLFTSRTKIVSIAHVSNALGTIAPVRQMTAIAHRHGAKVLVDGAQAVSHLRADVQSIDADFYVFSGHKVFGPTGIGVLYGKEAILNDTPPWQGGGNMIADVTFEKTQYQAAPARFEAGTGNIADAVGLGAAVEYLSRYGLEAVAAYEHHLLEYGTALLRRVPGLRSIGTASEKAGVLSFVIDGIRTEEIGQALNHDGIAVRTGHHCAQPILRRFGLEGTARASLALYNTCEDLDALAESLMRLQASAPRQGGRR